jgi:hypothetical protein
MDKKYWENKNITVYWWNGRTKSLDYKGTYKGFLEAKDIKVRSIKDKNNNRGWRFKIPLLSCNVIYDDYVTDYFKACDDAIKIFLTLLGDKSKLITWNRELNINW